MGQKRDIKMGDTISLKGNVKDIVMGHQRIREATMGLVMELGGQMRQSEKEMWRTIKAAYPELTGFSCLVSHDRNPRIVVSRKLSPEDKFWDQIGG